MREIEFRLNCLKRSIKKFDGKRIALYGIAANAKAILRDFPEQNIIALLDEKHVGKYICGKKIISLEDAVRLDIEVIIIAAEAASSWIVSERISGFCQTHSILLLNMYGMDEQEIKRQILVRDLEYERFNEGDLNGLINRNEIICCQLMDVLCVGKYFKKEEFFKDLEEFCGMENLARNRICSENMIDSRRPYSLKDIYNNYWTITLKEKEEIQRLQEKEEDFFLENIIPLKKMVAIVNTAFEQGKKIFIVSELYYSETVIKRLLKKIGIKKYNKIIQGNIVNRTVSDGAIRHTLGKDIEKNVLYIGTNDRYNLILPQMYQMEICLIKSVWDILWQFSDLRANIYEMEEEQKKSLWESLHRKLDSPFIEDIRGCIDSEKIEDFIEKEFVLPDLYDLPVYFDMKELEIINFPEVSIPVVSIIIPVHNEFGYTYNCLKSIYHNTKDVKYEVIVVDDASTDDTRRLDELVNGIRILRNESNLLFLQSCNKASVKARGKYLVFLNNDTQVQYNWLKPLVLLLEKDPNIGMAGSKLLYPDGKLQEAGGIIWQDGTAANYGRGDSPDMPEYNYVREVDYISGASIIVRKTLWDEIGGFDERYIPAYCEDSDLAMEVRKRNKKVMYQPASVVVHFEGISNGKDTDKGIKRYQVINTEKFLQKWKETLREKHYQKGTSYFVAREKKSDRKTILIFRQGTPMYDYDAGSKTIYNYIPLFLEKGYLVKFVPSDFLYVSPYTYEMQQLGVEVLYGDQYKKNFDEWILKNQPFIDYAILNCPNYSERFINILKSTSIKTQYYENNTHFIWKPESL